MRLGFRTMMLAALGAATTAHAASSREATTHFARELSAAFTVGDAGRLGALFAERAELSWVDEPVQARGRPAIESALQGVREHFGDARLLVGRVWVSGPASVLEVVLAGTRSEGTFGERRVSARKVGVVGALLVVFDARGLVQTARLYADWITYTGQVAPSALPADMGVRPPLTAVPNGTDVLEAHGTPLEVSNLATTNAIWGHLNGHRPAETMAPASDRYLYEDYTAPKSLGKADTQRMITDFLALLPDFELSSKPMQVAAGLDVVTEMSERGTFKNKPIALHSLDVKRFEQGKVIQEWQYSDYAAVLRQLTDVKVGWTPEP